MENNGISCKPNSKLVFDNETKEATLHALRDINENEEITISYFNNITHDGDDDENNKNISHHYGFKCKEKCYCVDS